MNDTSDNSWASELLLTDAERKELEAAFEKRHQERVEDFRKDAESLKRMIARNTAHGLATIKEQELQARIEALEVARVEAEKRLAALEQWVTDLQRDSVYFRPIGEV